MWSSWIPVVTPNVLLQSGLDFDPYSGVVGFDQLEDDLAGYQDWLGSGIREVQRRFEEIDLWIADQDFGNAYDRQQIRNQLTATYDTSTAEWTYAVNVVATDVDTASLENHLFHESFLFSQPYHFTYVICPFSGYVGNDTKEAVVQVTVPNVTTTPIVLLYLVSSASLNVFPGLRAQGAGSDQAGYAVESWAIEYNVVSATRIDVNFVKGSGQYSPKGAYMILMRDPT